MTTLTAIENHRDEQLARGLVEEFGRDGWLFECAALGEAGWEARVTCPTLPSPIVGRGLSRLSAISQAHVRAIRKLSPLCKPAFDEARASENDRSGGAPGPVTASGPMSRLEIASTH